MRLPSSSKTMLTATLTDNIRRRRFSSVLSWYRRMNLGGKEFSRETLNGQM